MDEKSCTLISREGFCERSTWKSQYIWSGGSLVLNLADRKVQFYNHQRFQSLLPFVLTHRFRIRDPRALLLYHQGPMSSPVANTDSFLDLFEQCLTVAPCSLGGSCLFPDMTQQLMQAFFLKSCTIHLSTYRSYRNPIDASFNG